MPAPDTGASKPPEGARAIVETLGLDAGALGDGDLSALTLPHNSDQFTSTELETLANIQAELDRLNSTVEGSLGETLEVGGEDLESDTIESVVTVVRKDYKNEPPSPEAILPEIMEETTLATEEIDMHEISISAPSPDTVTAIQAATSSSKQIISSCNNATLTSKTTGSSIVVIQSPIASSASLTNPSSGTTHVTVSGGQIFSKIPGIPGSVAISSVPQFQPLNQTLVTAKSADGKNIVQLRPARQVTTSVASGNVTGNLHGIKPLQGSIKRSAEAGGPTTPRNVFAKVIITGNHQGQQPLLLTSEAGDTFTSAQPIKIISGNASQGSVSILGSPTKAISLSQAQQMGLLSPGKLQQIIPSSPMKQNIIVNKLVTSPVKSPTKITVVPASSLVKPPAKILPAPTNTKPDSQATVDTGAKPAVSPQKVIIRQVKTEPQTSMEMTTVNSNVKPVLSPQKVIIQQGSSLKPGTLLTSAAGTGQVIRIPATQNVMASSGNIAQLQMPANRPVQYLRLVSTPSTVSGVGKPHPSVTTLSPNIGKQSLAAAMRTTQTPIRMVPIAPANSSAIRNIVPKSASGHQGQRIIIPAATPITQIRAASNVTLSASAVNQIPSGATLLQSGGNSYFMVTTQLVQNEQAQAQQQQQSVLNTTSCNTQSSNSSNTSPAEVPSQSKPGGAPAARTTLEPNGIRPRKPCNCTKSQCLKLYCDCFANGEFCHMCNCNNCFNNLEHEEDRQKAIRSCLDRNPHAFRPKIGKGIVGDERRHNKGCNCKRSGCLKNYCECYEAKIPCSNNCKCVGCRNIEDSSDKKSLRDLADAAEVRVQQQTAVKNKLSQQIQDIAFRPVSQAGSGTRQPNTFMSQEVVDATCLCMLAQAEQGEKEDIKLTEGEQSILEEFGRCLVQIIACASKAEGMLKV